MTDNPESPKMPHEELFLICSKLVGEAIWAIGMSADKEGKHIWDVYCSDKNKLKKIPKTFMGRPVQAVYCQKPSLLQNKGK